jgi:hypothetical protein
MSSVKDLKLIADGYKKSDSKAFEAAVGTFGKPYSKFLKGDLEKLIGLLGPSKITVPTRRSSSVGPKKSPKGKKPRSRSRSASKGKSPVKKATPKRRASSKSGPCDRDGKYMCDKDEMCNATQKKCVPSTFRTTKAHRFLVGDDGNLYVGSQATMELVADSKGISRRRIKETKEAAMKVSPSPNRGASRSRSRSATRSATRSISRQRYTSSDSGATILMKSPSPTMKLPTPRSRSRASSKGKGKRRTASRSRSASRASSKGKGKRRSSSRTSRSASRQRSASRDPSFTKCADDFVRGKYCADDKPFCNVKTGNCTKIMSKTAPKYTHAGRTVYAPEEDIIKRFESYHKKLTTRGRSRSRSAKRASKSKSRSRSAKRASKSKSRSRSRSRSQSASAKRYNLRGCQSYDAPDCPAEKPYCGSSGACIKTKPTGGNYIQLNGKKIYGQVATLESLMKSVGAKSPILKDDGKKAATPKKATPVRRRSTSKSASRRRSTSQKATPKKSPPRRNTPIPSGSWAKGCYAPDAPDCDDGTYCGTSGKCIKTKGTYVLELSGKKIYGSMDALTKLASTAGVSESKIKKSSDLKAAAAPVRARSRSASKGKAPVRARSRSRSASRSTSKSPAKKSPAKDVSDADIISAFESCIKKK